jgi:hypothetical protein
MPIAFSALAMASLPGRDTIHVGERCSMVTCAAVSAIAGTSVTYTPAANFGGGTDEFEYTVSDGSRTDVGAVEVTVSPVDDRPVANADSASKATMLA